MAKSFKSKPMAALHENMSDLHRAGAIDSGRMQRFDELCQAKTALAERLTYHVFKDASGQWRWSLTAGNGKKIADSGEGYKTKAACLAAIELVKKSAKAPVAA